MAIFPCDVGPHKHSGKNINFYIGMIKGPETKRYSLRLCDLHWGQIEPHLAKYEVVVDSSALSGNPFPDWCASCGEPVHERGWQLFVTAYPPQHDRKDYWFQIHDQCTLPRFVPKEPSRAGA